MMRIFQTGGLALLMIVMLRGSEIDVLLTATGADFITARNELVANDEFVAQAREASFRVTDLTTREDLRRELLRRIIIAQADVPALFSLFDQLPPLVRPQSPLISPDWWQGIIDSGRVEPAAALWGSILRTWMDKTPATLDEMIAIFQVINPDLEHPDVSWLANRHWPAIAYGLSMEPVQLRTEVKYIFVNWCKEDNYSDVSLEGSLWHCERAGYDREITSNYRVILRMAFKSNRTSKHLLVNRELDMLLAGGHFVSQDDSDKVSRILDSTKTFGISGHAQKLRSIADMPLWQPYREAIMETAEHVEKSDGIERK